MAPTYIYDSIDLSQGDGKSSGWGATVWFAIGGSISDHLVIAALLHGGSVSDPDVDISTHPERVKHNSMSANFYGVMGDYYFNPKKGTHIQAFVGGSNVYYEGKIGNITYDNTTQHGNLMTVDGFGFGLGGGHTWWMSNQWSLGVLGRVIFSPKLTGEDAVTGKDLDHSTTLLLVGLDAIYH
jgi:hypothetical protein